MIEIIYQKNRKKSNLTCTPAFAAREQRGASTTAMEKASDEAVFHRIGDWFATRGKTEAEAKQIKAQRKAERAAKRAQKEAEKKKRELEKQAAKAKKEMERQAKEAKKKMGR